MVSKVDFYLKKFILNAPLRRKFQERLLRLSGHKFFILVAVWTFNLFQGAAEQKLSCVLSEKTEPNN